jgi:hypothetical protein
MLKGKPLSTRLEHLSSRVADAADWVRQLRCDDESVNMTEAQNSPAGLILHRALRQATLPARPCSGMSAIRMSF